MGFDVARVRAQYPGLAEGYVQFDGAAGTLVSARAADAVATALRSAISNHTTAFEPGRTGIRIVDAARAAIGDLLGVPAAGVVFGNSTTSLTYLVARTLADTWRAGDEVVVSRLDHDANVRPWLHVAERSGATVRWAEFNHDTGELPAEQYDDLVNERTRLVAVTAGSNAIGTRPDVAGIARRAHAAGALLYVDGVHATPHGPIDVTALGADFYATSAYKWSGPHIAACVADPARWEALRPEKLRPSPNDVPERFEFGTLCFELLAGMAGAVEHLADLVPSAPGPRRARILSSLTAARDYEMELFAELVAGLAELPAVSMCPAPADRCPTVAFRIHGQSPGQTAAALGDEGICVFAGDYYAYEYFRAMGLRDSGGAVRASVYHYNTADEVARLLDAVKRLAG
ncbi:MAG: cysteine desulfurase-like protein [Micromonosporaceae bacterium]